MKNLLLILFLLPIVVFAQDGGSSVYSLKIPSFATGIKKITAFDEKGYIVPIPNGSENQVLQIKSGVPSWQNVSTGGVSDHTQLTSLAWGLSGHTGTPTSLASFDSGGTATTTLISSFAPASGSGNYIWNGTTTQTANFNISGNGVIGGYVQATTVKLTNLTDGYIPYHISDASGLGNSPIYTDGANVGVGYSSGTEITNNKLAVNGSGYFNGTINSTGYLLNGNNLHNSLISSYLPYWTGYKFENSGAFIFGKSITNLGSAYNSEQIGSVANPSFRIVNNQVSEYNIKGELQFDFGNNGTSAAITALYTSWAGTPVGGFGADLVFSTKIAAENLAERLRITNSGAVKVNNLAGTGTRIVGATEDGTLMNIPNATGYLQNDGSGNMSFNYPEITSLRSTGATTNQVATANGSSGMQFQSLKTVNSNSLFGTGNVAVGDVFKVGTPSNKQLGVWTGDGTIQGVSGLTFGESQAGLKIPYPDGFSRIRLDDASNPFDVTNFSSYTSLQYPYGSAALNIYSSGAVEMPNLANSSQSHILYYNPSNGLITYSTNTGGSSQWNNDTYGINYTAGRIGIGSVSNNYTKLNIEASTNDYYGAQIFSYSTALSLRGNGSSGAPVFEVRDGSYNDRFHINADGSIYASTGLGSAITSYNLYFNTSTGQITYGAAGSGGGMTDPMTTAGDIIIRNSSNTTSRLGIGTSGQILTVVGGVPSWQNAPSGTSQWNTDTYGINYTNNVGIGNSSSNVAGLAVYKDISSGYAGYFSNTNASAFGVSIRTGSNGSQPILTMLGNTSTPRFDFKSDGSMYAYSLTNVDQSYVLGYNNATGQITYLPKPSGGGGSGTVTSFSSGNLSPLFITSVSNATTTPALSFSAVSQAQNLVYASPNGSSGTPTFRKIVVRDISASGTPSASTYLDGSGTWSTPPSATNYWSTDTYGIYYGGNVGINGSNVLGFNFTTTGRAKFAYSGGGSAYAIYSTSNGTLANIYANNTGSNGAGIYCSATGTGGIGAILEGQKSDIQVSMNNVAPTSASATGTAGEIRVTADYIYVCVATNTWKRVQLVTW